MKIKTHLMLTGIISVGLIIAMAVSLSFYFVKMEHASQESRAAGLLLKEIAELVLVTDAYLAYQYERSLQQWEIKYTKINDVLAGNPSVFRKIDKDIKSLAQSFRMLQASFVDKKQETDIIVSEGIKERNSILKERAQGRVRVYSSRIFTDTFKIFQDADHRANRLQKYAITVFMGFSLFLISVISFAYYLIIRKITTPIKALLDGTTIIGEGELNYQIPLKQNSNDEFKQLIEQFNLMAVKLSQSDASLRESETKYRQIFKNIQDVYYESSLDGEILEISPSIKNISGYKRKELIGKSLYDFYVNSEERDEFIQTILKKHIVNDYNITLKGKDNFQRTCSIVSALVKDEIGNPTKIVGSMRDITERRRLEEELLRAQKLESVGLLAGGIAHDFNNILTTILGNVSMARMQAKPEDEIFDLLKEAETASIRAQALTKQLLTFAKGGVPLKETASIKDILKESCSFVMRGSKSGCEFSMPEDLWPAEVDVGQISQVINNVVINANQAMPKGGIIQVAAENLIIDDGHGLPVKPGRYIKLSIKDQGVGIAKEHLSNIFDPYFTTKQEGSGLGLATTYSIIKKHDGHITVESQLGVGTTFHVYLPASEKAVPEKEEARLIKGQGRILVMDDEAPLRKMVGRMLGNLGYESEFAKDGAEAIRMVKEAEKPYDAVILDLTIPGGMGGKEAINKLLEIDPQIKAIVSSGYSDDPVLSNFQEYGFKV